MKMQIKKIASLFLCICMALSMLTVASFAAETTATLTFDANKENRESFSSTQQVWKQNGITFTNNKSKSSTAVADYGNPVRLYQDSEIIVEYPNMDITKIEFTASSSSYATALKNSITTDNGTSVSVSGSKVTVAFEPAVSSFTITLSKQVRLNSLTVTGTEASGETPGEGGETPGEGGEDTTVTPSGAYYEKVTTTPDDWSADTYLIVYETDGVAFNGALEKLDAGHNTVSTGTITNGIISATAELKNAEFKIAALSSGVSVQSASGFYIGKSATSNGMDVKTAAQTNTITFSEGNVVIAGSGGLQLQFNSSSGDNNYRFRYYKSDTQKAIALYKYVADIKLGADIEVGSDLTVNFYATIDGTATADKDVKMDITMNGKTTTVAGIVDNGKYAFAFDGIAPHYMTKEIEAKLFVDGKEVKSITKTVKDIAKAYIDGDYSPETQAFAKDLLHYGAASQKYTTEADIADSDLANYGIDAFVAKEFDSKVKEGIGLSTSDTKYFRGANVWFANQNSIIVNLQNLPENARLFVNGNEVAFSGTSYTTKGLMATELGNLYKFTVCDAEGNELQSLTYSVNYYAYAMSNHTNTEMAKLAKTLYNYGVSAVEYKNSLS